MRTKMLKDLGGPVLFDTIATVVLIGILLRNSEPVKQCSP